MQPGKRSGLRSDHDFPAAAPARATKPIPLERDPSFLAGADNGAVPTADYDEALDTMAAFLTDGFYEFFGEERQSFDIGEDGFITVAIKGLTKAGRVLARQAMDVWTDATGIEFQIVKRKADITFRDDLPNAYTMNELDGNTITSSTIIISEKWLQLYGKGPQDYSMLTFIHEFGHALGLGHGGIYGGQPQDNPPPPLPNDSWQATVMSYSSQDENDNVDADRAIPVTPMMADILAIQDLYGMKEIRTGNDLYNFKADFMGLTARTIVDTGGIDTLDLSWSTRANTIDLHDETYSSIQGVHNNMMIARGTVIEAVIGGGAGDTIIGNDYANALYGNLGNDTLTGNGGDDFFVFDTAPSAGNVDTITDFTPGEDRLVFNNARFMVGADGTLSASAFVANTTGQAGDFYTHIIYNTATGELLYDVDGNEDEAPQLVARLTPGLDLSAADVLVV